MKALEFTGLVTGGRLPRDIEHHIADAIRRFEGKLIKITMAVRKRRRSLNQNAFYHGVVLPVVVGMYRDFGNEIDAESVHDLLRQKFGITCTIIGPHGEIQTILRSSTDLGTTEWEVWIEKIRAFCAEFGAVVPFPNE